MRLRGASVGHLWSVLAAFWLIYWVLGVFGVGEEEKDRRKEALL
nr:MAG TPA: NUAM protein [Caudoviricetes sp.]